MSQLERTLRWRVMARSERGSSHIRKGLPNQDAVNAFVLPDGSAPVILAVADGHGSEKCFRSQTGASLAVETTHQALREFLDTAGDKSISAAKDMVEQQVPTRIIRAWKRRVAEHLQSHPITEQELEPLKAVYGVTELPLPDNEGKSLQPYGATLLGALITADYAVYLQIGDGEILVLSDEGNEVVHPIPEDERLIVNETTSLCQENPLPDFRVVFQRVERVRPALVLLSTDGFPNSFSDPDGLAKFAPKLLAMLRDDPDGIERDYLPPLLRKASDEGSGDDITLAIAFRPILPPTAITAAASEATATSPGTMPNAALPVAQESVAEPELVATALDESQPASPTVSEQIAPETTTDSMVKGSGVPTVAEPEQRPENSVLPRSVKQPSPHPAEVALPMGTASVASGSTSGNCTAAAPEIEARLSPTNTRIQESVPEEPIADDTKRTGSKWDPRNWNLFRREVSGK